MSALAPATSLPSKNSIRLNMQAIPQKELDQIIALVRNRTVWVVEVNGSALTREQVKLFEEAALEHKGFRLVNLEGGIIGGVYTDWVHYQSPQLEELPQLRPSPEKGIELYIQENHEPPKLAVDFGAGPGINIIAMLEKGVEFIHAIDCAPEAKRDFFINLGRLRLEDEKDRVNYHTCEFDQWSTDKKADFLIANYTWPYRPPEKFGACWKKTLEVIRVGGYLCGEFFEPPIEEMKKSKLTYHTEDEVRSLVTKTCTLLWLKRVPLSKSRSSLDLSKQAQSKALPWGGLIRIVAKKN